MDHSLVLRVFRVHFGWILPFAIVGIVSEGRRLPLVLLPIAVALVTCILFYVSSEYRHPVVPCLLLFAAIGARRLAQMARSGAAPAAASAVILLGLMVFANAPDPLLDRLTTRRADNLNFATLALEAGDAREAEALARKSIAIDPAWAPSRRKLADALVRLGCMDEAAEEARIASRLDGEADATGEEMRRAQESFTAGRFEEARTLFLDIASRGGAARAQALNNAALACAEAGRVAEADSLLAAAVLADSTYSSPWVHRGRLALARGDSAAALRFAERALALAPEDGRALRLRERARGNAPVP
jgi:tetratricopeptide (TPR) repeat protein